MPEDTTGVAKPPLDPAAILSKLEGIMKANQAPAATGGGSKSWIGTIIMVVVALAGAAIWAWLSARANRELAALRHEKEKARIEADQAAARATVTANDQAIAAAQKDVAAAAEKLRLIDAEIRTEEARHEADRRAIDRIRSWDDVPGPR